VHSCQQLEHPQSFILLSMTPLLLILVSVLALASANGPFSSKGGNPFARPGNFGGDRTVNNVASSVAEDMGTEEAMPIPTSRPKQTKEREQLYEAYNLLHTLAQDFHKPFDAPAVVVVGHQTSGKSALIEALMCFQFNQVGGGTKTRRPIALRMQYNPACTSPMCFLTLENGKEEQRSLTDIQTYIEAENRRLERDPTRSFDTREINIRMEYRFCPNMIVIDTPGMLHSPKGRNLNPQQRA
jgi:ribosome biogenesis GTPase A